MASSEGNSVKGEEKMPSDIDMSGISEIKNKRRRHGKYVRLKREKTKLKRKIQREKRKAGVPKMTPKTIDSMREKDVTMLTLMEDEQREELNAEFAQDEMSTYFGKTYEPKVLITCSDIAHKKSRIFARELCRIIPNSFSYTRKNAAIKKTIEKAGSEGYTDMVVINEDQSKPNGLLVIHLPDGPTAHFRLSNVKLTSDIKRRYKAITKHRPEVILSNFSTHLGNRVARMLGALFHYDPQFKGRRAVTFHNQRDYIFFRHHRYQFASSSKVKLRELGPRFTLKLRSLQVGTFDSKTGEYEWIITDKRHEMETSRRRFFL